MPRRKISEYRAKQILNEALKSEYVGWEIDTDIPTDPQLKQVHDARAGNFVVKVDQGIKARFKKGLVSLDVSLQDLPQAISKLKKEGYRWVLVEPFFSHNKKSERYIAAQNTHKGIMFSYSPLGGVDIESNPESVVSTLVSSEKKYESLAKGSGLTVELIAAIVKVMNSNHISFLEINPYVIDSNLQILDVAAEVDDAGMFFVDTWAPEDFRDHVKMEVKEERIVADLAQKSPASFKLELINPNGSIFLLLSGGGASIVVADEIYNRGQGSELANYGEYSGNPNAEETQLYTEQVLKLLIKSKAKKKVLFIGGAVANFTDIANTFSGIINAVDKYAKELQDQKVKVFVRRGGPRQEVGLLKIKTALTKHDLLGSVNDNKVSLPDFIQEALEELA